jgi:hypothetical protein
MATILYRERTMFIKRAQSFFRMHTVGSHGTKKEAGRRVWHDNSYTTNKTYPAA